MADKDTATEAKFKAAQEAPAQHDLFTVDGRPMWFYVPLSKTGNRAPLCQLIKKYGGEVSRNYKPGCICVMKVTTTVPPGYEVVYVDYILDSVLEGERQTLENYLIPAGDAPARPTQAQKAAPKTPPRPTVGGRLPYTDEEDEAMINYLRNAGFPKGNTIFKKMEEAGVTAHTWQSMENRFRKTLLPRLNQTGDFHRGLHSTSPMRKRKATGMAEGERWAKRKRSEMGTIEVFGIERASGLSAQVKESAPDQPLGSEYGAAALEDKLRELNVIREGVAPSRPAPSNGSQPPSNGTRVGGDGAATAAGTAAAGASEQKVSKKSSEASKKDKSKKKKKKQSAAERVLEWATQTAEVVGQTPAVVLHALQTHGGDRSATVQSLLALHGGGADPATPSRSKKGVAAKRSGPMNSEDFMNVGETSGKQKKKKKKKAAIGAPGEPVEKARRTRPQPHSGGAVSAAIAEAAAKAKQKNQSSSVPEGWTEAEDKIVLGDDEDAMRELQERFGVDAVIARVVELESMS